jgi:hypothetical protein
MSLFSKTKIIFYPKSSNLEIYFDRKENNVFSFEIDLWKAQGDVDLQPIAYFIKQKKIKEVTVIIPDDISLTKSFIYDSQISSIEKKEVVGLAESFISFKIDPDYLEYKLINSGQKTIIKATIYQKEKLSVLRENLLSLGLSKISFISTSSSISKIIAQFNPGQYFMVYPLEQKNYLLFLSTGVDVYLSTVIKGPVLDIQKVINYSSLYFDDPTDKIYIKEGETAEINFTSEMVKTNYSENQIATEFKKPSNLPLPVVGALIDENTSTQFKSDIIPIDTSNNSLNKPKNMENKKNILPFISVIIVTAVIASIAFWFVSNRDQSEVQMENNDMVEEISQEVIQEEIPEPTPTPIEISKDIKIQVLNATSINGQAATLKTILTKYEFESIAVGNSTENLTVNEVRYKPSMATASAYFKEKLVNEFPNADHSDILKETSKYDVVFLVGTDLSEVEAEITPTPTMVEETEAPVEE